REARHLDIIAEQVVWRRQLVDLAIEVALLVIPARPPAQTAADVEVLAKNVPDHVRRRDTFGRAFVMGAAGGVHMVVPRIPSFRRRMDPALKTERLGMSP